MSIHINSLYGYCCNCCDVDSEDERAQLMRLERIAALPTAELLNLLDEAVLQAVSAAARVVVDRLGSERIYGFILMHYLFLNCGVSVLTEAQLERSVRLHTKRSPDASKLAGYRWTPVDSGYYFFREDLFAEVGYLIMPLEDRQQQDEVERIFIRAMHHVRKHIFTDPGIVLGIMDYTEGSGFDYINHAELFNDAATLARYKEEMP